MNIYFIQEKTASGWKPVARRCLSASFTRRHLAKTLVRRYVKRHDELDANSFRVLKLSVQ